MTGIQNGAMSDQLENFANKLSQFSSKAIETPENWMQAFDLLKKHLTKIRTKKKKVIFLDELPWIDTHKSKFLGMLGHFWNDWACLLYTSPSPRDS